MNETILKNGKLIVNISKEFDTTKDISLGGTQITSLPEGLIVGGSLDLEGTQIKKEEVPKHLIKKVRK